MPCRLLLLSLALPAWALNTFGEPAPVAEVQRTLGAGMPPYITSGCLPTVPASSLTFTGFACTGFVHSSDTPPKLIPVVQASATLTLPNTDGTWWLALHRDLQTDLSGGQARPRWR